MKNKTKKQEILNNGKFKELKNLDRTLYKKYECNLFDFIEEIDINDKNKQIASYRELIIYILTHANIKDITIEEIKCYFQLINAKKIKANRIRKQIQYYALRGYPIIFGTFTFNEEALKLNPKYRKEIITRELNKNPNIVDYIGNIDFGKENEREHYHYIIFCKKDFMPIINEHKNIINLNINYNKGHSFYEEVNNDKTDFAKIGNYINKLPYHALKRNKFEKMIYKRNSPYQQFKKQIERHKKEIKEAEQERQKRKEINKIKDIEKDFQMNIENIKNFIN